MKIEAGAKVVFAGDHTGALLFDVMRKAGLLESFTHELTGEQLWGTMLEDESIEATITNHIGVAAAYDKMWAHGVI